ncbi:DoxX family protein [Telluribacter sp. SYSU D00476]|uniref:DoxX family protein n=1 Tax=Telluribacter sp. SYSU D00476 TaxID=2811430 RepID=UPI001FF46F4D|nr:DoxX family protein [Telluribacter sp. SYSU D00476]
MNVVHRIERWGETHHPAWLDIVRIALGVLLFVKGISFISDTTRLAQLVNGLNFDLWSVMAVHYVAFAHIFGGFLIALGSMTRLACILQIPILFFAVFFVNLRMGFSYLNSELWLSVITLLLVIVFTVAGSGKFSMDEWMRTHDH